MNERRTVGNYHYNYTVHRQVPVIGVAYQSTAQRRCLLLTTENQKGPKS